MATDSYVEEALSDSEHFRPSWRDADQPRGFEGTYRDYLVWRGPVQNNVEGVVAVDMRDWHALKVEEHVLRGRWIAASVRQLTNADLRQIEAECTARNEKFDEEKYRQYCLLEGRLLLSLEVSDVESHVAVFYKRSGEAPDEGGKDQ
jgi:hypothetical protein